MRRYWTLWHRHLFKQILKQSFFTLSLLLGLYTFIDASVNLSELKKLQTGELWVHYGALFIKRIPQLLPFAFLITSVKLLLDKQKHHELISLRMSGASKFSLMTPFLVASVIFCSLNWSLNEGLFSRPVEMKSVNFNPMTWLSSSWNLGNQEPLEAIPLDDELESWLIFHHYYPEKKEFNDVFWIKDAHQWWHFKKLAIQPLPTEQAIAYEADCFEWQPGGKRLWRGHFEELNLDMSFDEAQLVKDVRPAQELNIIQLYHALKGDYPHIQKPKMRSYLYFRLLQPLLCLLSPLAAASVCLRYSRSLPTLMAYIVPCSILGMTLMLQQSGLLLATSARMHPIFSIGCVSLAIFLMTGYAVKRA
jgi:lipopolysaccharide export LptBFGC system permease protein LptF